MDVQNVGLGRAGPTWGGPPKLWPQDEALLKNLDLHAEASDKGPPRNTSGRQTRISCDRMLWWSRCDEPWHLAS